MDSSYSFLVDVVKWILTTLGTVGLYLGGRAVKKYDNLELRVSENEKKLLTYMTALVQAELKATKTYVDKAEFINAHNKLESKMDTIADKLAKKMDFILENMKSHTPKG